MLTAQGIAGLHLFFKFTSSSYHLPIQWDPAREALRGDLKPWEFCLWLLITTIHALNILRMHVEFWINVLCPKPDTAVNAMEMTIHLIFTLGQSMGLLYNLVVALKQYENVNCVNQWLSLDRILRVKFKDHENLQKELMSGKGMYVWTNKVLPYIIPWAMSNLMVTAGMVLVDSQDHRWGWHLFNSSKSVTPYLVLWSFVEMFHYLATYLVIVIFWFFYPFVLILSLVFWIEFLREITSNKLQVPGQLKNELEAYRAMETLMAIYNDCNGDLSWPLNLGFNLFFNVICIFVCIKFSQVMDTGELLFLGVWGLFYVFVDYGAYPIGGSILERSEKLLRSWRVQVSNKDKAGRRELRALRPISVNIGGMFSMGRITPLLMMFMASNLTLNCLLLS